MTDGLNEQLRMNSETLAKLKDSGVSDGQLLEVEAFFFAVDEASASSLVAALEAHGWRACADRARRGLLKKKVTWSVQATKALLAEADALDGMVQQLDALAEKHGADFDGWGAEVPDQP